MPESVHRRAIDWPQATKLFVAVFLGILGFFALNVWISRAYPARCADCDAHIGFPFAYYAAGGIAGDDRLLWFGIAGDLLVVLAVSFGVVLAWERFGPTRNRR